MQYSSRLLKTASKKQLYKGPSRLQDVRGNLQPPGNDALAFPWIIPNFLSPAECGKIIQFSESLPSSDSKVSSMGKDSTVRKSEVQWLFPNHDTDWIFDYIERAITRANQDYKFELYGFFQGAQIGTYGTEG